MGTNLILKDEVGDIVMALYLSMEAATLSGAGPDSAAFNRGYCTALQAVASSLGLRVSLPPRQQEAEARRPNPPSLQAPSAQSDDGSW
jgi:hypothetical protein